MGLDLMSMLMAMPGAMKYRDMLVDLLKTANTLTKEIDDQVTRSEVSPNEAPPAFDIIVANKAFKAALAKLPPVPGITAP